MSALETKQPVEGDGESCCECGEWIPGPLDPDLIARGAICSKCMAAIEARWGLAADSQLKRPPHTGTRRSLEHAGRLRSKLDGVIEADAEWRKFASAIQKARPATETFTNQALMLMYLALGDQALKPTK